MGHLNRAEENMEARTVFKVFLLHCNTEKVKLGVYSSLSCVIVQERVSELERFVNKVSQRCESSSKVK